MVGDRHDRQAIRHGRRTLAFANEHVEIRAEWQEGAVCTYGAHAGPHARHKRRPKHTAEALKLSFGSLLGEAVVHDELVVACEAHHRVPIAGVLVEQPSPHRQLIQLGAIATPRDKLEPFHGLGPRVPEDHPALLRERDVPRLVEIEISD